MSVQIHLALFISGFKKAETAMVKTLRSMLQNRNVTNQTVTTSTFSLSGTSELLTGGIV